MTRPATERSPLALFPDLEPLPAMRQAFEAPSSTAAGAGAGAGNAAVPSSEAAAELYQWLPDDEGVLGVLTEGPLLPFDYCWLRGQRHGLVPVVQTQLVKRNPRLSVVDRTPLGIDPNADLFRCFLMHGNPNEPVTVYTFYERHVCAGVIGHYFQLPDIQRYTRDHYIRLNWALGEQGVPAAALWLAAYDKALDVLFDLLREAKPRARARLASEYAEWLAPMLRRADLTDGVLRLAQEVAVISAESAEDLTPHRRIVWDWLGDFTFLSIISQTAFCAFAWMKQVQFPNLVRQDAETGRDETVGLFRPRYIKTAMVGLWVGLLIMGTVTAPTGGPTLGGVIIGGLLAFGAAVVLLLNLVFWLMYTSHYRRLMKLVPKRWQTGKPKNLGYLR